MRELPPAYFSRRLPQRMTQVMKTLAMTLRSRNRCASIPGDISPRDKPRFSGTVFFQVAKTILQERKLFAGCLSMLINVTRRDVTLHTRLVAVLGLEALSKELQRSWAYALAADSSAHIGGISYFCVRVRIPPLSMHDDIYDLQIVSPPMRGAYG
jgi:hypothetical protein